MKDLIVDTGLVTYNINGSCQFSFNPTDSGFVEKLFNAFDTLDKKQDAYKAEVEKTANKREVFETARKMDEEMRDIINDVFGFDICTALFGEMNVYALADGLPVWANLMLSIMDEVDTTLPAKARQLTPALANTRRSITNDFRPADLCGGQRNGIRNPLRLSGHPDNL